MRDKWRLKPILQLMTGSISQAVCLALLGFVLAALLSVEDFGIVRAINVYWAVWVMLGHLCLHDAVAALLLKRDSIEAQATCLTTAVVITCVVSIGLNGCFLVIYGFLLSQDISWQILDVFVILQFSLPIVGVTTVLSAALVAMKHIAANACLQVINGIVFLVLIFLFTFFWSINGWLFGRIVSAILLLIFVLFCFKMYFKHYDFSIEEGKRLLSVSVWQLPSGLISLVQQNIDILLLCYFASSEDLGCYTFLLLFVKGVGLLHNAVAKTFFSLLDDVTQHQVFMLYMFVVSLLAVAINVFLSATIIPWIYADKFLYVIDYLPLMSISLVFTGVVTGVSYINIANQQFKTSLFISVLQLVLSLPIYIMGVKEYGVIGVIYAYLFASILHAFIAYAVYRFPTKNTVNFLEG